MILQLHSMDPDDNHESLLNEGEAPGRGVLIWLAVDDFEETVDRLR